MYERLVGIGKILDSGLEEAKEMGLLENQRKNSKEDSK